MMKLGQDELNELRAIILANKTNTEVEANPYTRPLVTQQDFLAACVIASLILLFILGK